MKRISRLHYITTTASLAEEACIGGIDWIQLRLKNIDYDAYREIALEVQAVCRQYNATLIINDNVKLALDIDADGVHLGKEDMDPQAARILLGDDFIIGCTANTFEDIARLSAIPIDYIGLGPFRFTNTKQNLSPVLGIEGYQQIFTRLSDESVKHPPIIGIGGVIENDVAALLSVGLSGIAVSGAISNARDVATAARAFKESVSSVSLPI